MTKFALVPIEATEEMLRLSAELLGSDPKQMKGVYNAFLEDSPNGGEVSRELFKRLVTAMAVCKVGGLGETSYAKAAIKILGLRVEGDG